MGIPGIRLSRQGESQGKDTLFSPPWRVFPAHQETLRLGIESSVKHPITQATIVAVYEYCGLDTVLNAVQTRVQISLPTTL